MFAWWNGNNVKLGRKLSTVTSPTCSFLADALRRLLWSLMATAARQKIMITSVVARSLFDTFKLNQIWYNWPQLPSSWMTLLTKVSSSSSSRQHSESVRSSWTSVTMMLPLRLWDRHCLLLMLMALLGAGRRCTHAGNASASQLKHQSSYILYHVERLRTTMSERSEKLS